MRRSQSLTRKFLESQAHAANTKRANDLDMGNDSNDYGSLSPVSTRAPVAESIREHSRTRLETSTSGQMRSMRRSTSKRNNGLATHASFDTVPVHDISAYDQPGPSIREHTAGMISNVLTIVCQQKMKIVCHLIEIPMFYGTNVDLHATDGFSNPPKDGSGEPIPFFKLT